MTATSIQQRLAALEADMAELKALVAKSQPKKELPWWEAIYGTFANDPYYAEAMRLGREYRESLRPKPRKKRKK